jgi:hypothetical protein
MVGRNNSAAVGRQRSLASEVQTFVTSTNEAAQERQASGGSDVRLRHHHPPLRMYAPAAGWLLLCVCVCVCLCERLSARRGGGAFGSQMMNCNKMGETVYMGTRSYNLMLNLQVCALVRSHPPATPGGLLRTNAINRSRATVFATQRRYGRKGAGGGHDSPPEGGGAKRVCVCVCVQAQH